MDFLRNIRKIESVYTHELNEILIRTPPKLFTISLYSIFTIFAILILISFKFEYTQIKEFNYVLNKNIYDKTEINFYLPDDIKLNKGDKIKIYNSDITKFEEIVIGTFSEKNEYFLDGKALDGDIILSDLNFDYTKIVKRKKVHLILEGQDLNVDEFLFGKLTIPVSGIKFYKLYLPTFKK